MNKCLALVCILAPLLTQAFPLNNCVYILGKNHQGLLPKIYEKFQKDHPENLCPVRFDVEPENDRSKDCKGDLPGGEKYTQTAARAVLDYRNINGELYTVTYPVCLEAGELPLRIGKIDGNRWKKLDEVSIRKIVHVEDRRGGPDNNDKNCDVSRTVNQKICAPAGYKVYGWEGPVDVSASENSKLLSAIPDPENHACVLVSFLLKGKGYDKVAGVNVNCHGSGWYEYTMKLHAYTPMKIEQP